MRAFIFALVLAVSYPAWGQPTSWVNSEVAGQFGTGTSAVPGSMTSDYTGTTNFSIGQISQPQSVVFGSDSKHQVTLHLDTGKVDYSDPPDEAAKTFWKSVELLLPDYVKVAHPHTAATAGPATLRYVMCHDICTEQRAQYDTMEECSNARDRLPPDLAGFKPVISSCTPTPTQSTLPPTYFYLQSPSALKFMPDSESSIYAEPPPKHCKTFSSLTITKSAGVTGGPLALYDENDSPTVVVEDVSVLPSPIVIDVCNGQVFIKPYKPTEGSK